MPDDAAYHRGILPLLDLPSFGEPDEDPPQEAAAGRPRSEGSSPDFDLARFDRVLPMQRSAGVPVERRERSPTNRKRSISGICVLEIGVQTIE
ncbi:hypothetical protein [Halorarum salinum]|uniref:Uncharacterized protein n=1 Tax=Halorarum salinum TaxID=2743089 RepID=A0A7D5LD95_9EURY|nr:hypothetical protein [Halobaculum salinum]QLG63209.1 hypothetical protein HUG12_16305 [Halobaculum salinum]